MDLGRQKRRKKMNSHHLRSSSLRSEEESARVRRGVSEKRLELTFQAAPDFIYQGHNISNNCSKKLHVWKAAQIVSARDFCQLAQMWLGK